MVIVMEKNQEEKQTCNLTEKDKRLLAKIELRQRKTIAEVVIGVLIVVTASLWGFLAYCTLIVCNALPQVDPKSEQLIVCIMALAIWVFSMMAVIQAIDYILKQYDLSNEQQKNK